VIEHVRRRDPEARRAVLVQELERAADEPESGDARDVHLVDQLLALRALLEGDVVLRPFRVEAVDDVGAAERPGVEDEAARGRRRHVARPAEREGHGDARASGPELDGARGRGRKRRGGASGERRGEPDRATRAIEGGGEAGSARPPAAAKRRRSASIRARAAGESAPSEPPSP
jgi:hypothetical protein